MMNEDAVELLKTSMWDLAACADGEPNVVPAAFKDVTADGKLLAGDVFLETTLKNIRSNDGKIAISVYKVEESLIPFHDASGRTLMDWLGMDPETFCGPYTGILPMDFYDPGKGKSGDLPPRSFIAETYHADLLALMQHMELTVLIGRYACFYSLKDRQKQNLTETVRHYADYLPQFFPITHPRPPESALAQEQSVVSQGKDTGPRQRVSGIMYNR